MIINNIIIIIINISIIVPIIFSVTWLAADVKEPTHLSKRVAHVVPASNMVYLIAPFPLGQNSPRKITFFTMIVVIVIVIVVVVGIVVILIVITISRARSSTFSLCPVNMCCRCLILVIHLTCCQTYLFSFNSHRTLSSWAARDALKYNKLIS